MNELVRAGKVRYPAVSNYAAWQVSEILWISEKKGFKPPYISQPMYNLLARGIEEEYLAFCRRFCVAVVEGKPPPRGPVPSQDRPGGPTPARARFHNNTL